MLKELLISWRRLLNELQHATELQVVETRRHLATHYYLNDLEDDDRVMIECQCNFDRLDRAKAHLAGVKFYQPKETK